MNVFFIDLPDYFWSNTLLGGVSSSFEVPECIMHYGEGGGGCI